MNNFTEKCIKTGTFRSCGENGIAVGYGVRIAVPKIGIDRARIEEYSSICKRFKNEGARDSSNS